MSAAAPPLADIVLSLAALLGLVVLDRVLCAAGRDDPVIRRFRFGLFAVGLVFLGRVLGGVAPGGWLRSVEYLGAGLIPLAVLLLTEGLLRRHAPASAKAVFAGGAGLVCLLALFPSALVDPARIWLALLLQLGGFAVAGWLVLTRDGARLSAAENRAAVRLALSLLLILPLAASDFLILVLDLPLRISGVAVLFLCWLAIGLWRGEAGTRAPMATFAVMTICAGAATGIVAAGFGMGRDGVILTLALILAAVLLSAVVAEGQAALAEAEDPSILSRLARWQGRDPVAFFEALAGHPAVAGAVFVKGRDMPGLDDPALGRLFALRPVLRRRDSAPVEPDLADLCAYLFDRYEATHFLQVRAAPRLLLALSLPTIAAGTRTEEELEIAQRMAALMEGGDAG